MSDARRILIAIPTFRREKLLPPLIEAIRGDAATTPNKLRIAVVDNDPLRSARDIAERAGVEYISEAFPGIAAVRQAGLDAAEDDELTIMIDDDVMPEPGWLLGLVTAWNDSRATAVVGYVQYVWPADADPWIVAGGFMRRDKHPSGTRLEGLSTGSVLFDTAAMRRLGVGFDRSLGLSGGEDLLVGRDILARGGTIIASSDSIARDEVPISRTTREFVRRRTIAQGQMRVSILSREATGMRRLVRRAAHFVGGLVRLLVFSTGAGFASLRGDTTANAVFQRRAWFAHGRILGALGRITPEYARPIQSIG